MSFTQTEVLDKTIEWIDLSVRTNEALALVFGKPPYVREVVTMTEDNLRTCILALNADFSGKLDVMIKELLEELSKYRLTLGMSKRNLPR